MEPNKSLASKDNGISSMEEFLQAIMDIQSIDFDELRAHLTQNSRHTSTDVSGPLMPYSAHVLESQRRETQRVRKQLEEEKNFREEYIRVFGRKEMKDLSKMLDNMESNIKRLQEEKTNLEEKIKSLDEEKRKAIAEKDNAVRGFSQRMKSQMTENKTSNEDLSDQNPPSKLGERYTMLYDNQWLHAFEVLTEKHGQSEENAIQILLNLLTECHNFAKMRADEQMKDLEQRMSGDPTIQIGEEVKRLLRSARKLVNVTRDGVLFQECKNYVQDVMRSAMLYLYEKEMKRYFMECFQLCWLMVIQDPPVVLAKRAMKGEDFDPDLYKFYTTSGTFIEFVVWPHLLLHEDGPLLAQGVAQPILCSDKQITKHAWDKGSDTIHREQIKRTTRKPDSFEHRTVITQTKLDDISRIRKDGSNHSLTSELTEVSTSSSSSSLSSLPTTSVSRAVNVHPTINLGRDNDTRYQMQSVKTETNFPFNQDQNATSRYDKSGDQRSIGTTGNYSQKTRSSDSIKQQDWSSKKSTNPPTPLQTGCTEHNCEPLSASERPGYEFFVRILTEGGVEKARKIFCFSFERYHAIYLASQVNFK